MRQVDAYLDVDGVWLPVYDPDDLTRLRVGGWTDWTGFTPGWGHGAYSPDMVAAMLTAITRPGVTVRWLTTWGPRAATDLAPRLGLPDWEVVDPDATFLRAEKGRVTPTSWWKRDAIQAEHAKRPEHGIVWVDDDLAFNAPSRTWINDLRRGGLPVYGLSPHTSLGLSRVQVERMSRTIDTMLEAPCTA